MSDQYKVDLSELEDTITKLNGVISQLGVANVCAKNDTYLPPGALGAGFEEAEQLTRAHEGMKTHIEAVVAYIHDVMNDFGGKTKKVHGHYSDAEYDAQGGMSGSGQ
ncbi:hypothetical protein [Actinacidiphila glaucinigra]|uniref:Uncharacterized protein n=1 Tax=Actinacidiphila glaucinigra TaxID=235986 RepID=A0A239NKB0_9ACTN|nr:hypothetical protein [Actinacidiphila glaucinigra]SNT54844.1 hypothetical protein SAMN05216252_13824 [Actinacidiphila glaucinigra]